MLAIEKQSRNWDGGHRDQGERKILSRGLGEPSEKTTFEQRLKEEMEGKERWTKCQSRGECRSG